MKRTDVMNSIELKKRFCKDNNLPISVYDNPYFYERLSVLDVMFDCIDKFEDFCLEMAKYDSVQAYFEYYERVKEAAITYIKDNSYYEQFIEEEFDTTTKHTSQNLYVEQNDGKTFISLDMKKANFSALHFYNPRIFKNCPTWEDFMRNFTDNSHIINSKYIRQVIMGACNPKKQIQYEKYLMNELLTLLTRQIGELPVFSVSNDEIIINAEDNGYALKEFYKVLEENPIGEYIRLTMFDLHKIKGTDGWIKNIYNFDSMFDAKDKVEFKCLDNEIYHQIVKHYYNEIITPNDLVFYYKGHLAAFSEAIDNPWSI